MIGPETRWNLGLSAIRLIVEATERMSGPDRITPIYLGGMATIAVSQRGDRHAEGTVNVMLDDQALQQLADWLATQGIVGRSRR